MKMTRKNFIFLCSSLLIFFSIICSLFSNYYNSRVMGDAALGVAILAPKEGSPEMERKRNLRRRADVLFKAGVVLASLGVSLQVVGIFIAD